MEEENELNLNFILIVNLVEEFIIEVWIEEVSVEEWLIGNMDIMM